MPFKLKNFTHIGANTQPLKVILTHHSASFKWHYTKKKNKNKLLNCLNPKKYKSWFVLLENHTDSVCMCQRKISHFCVFTFISPLLCILRVGPARHCPLLVRHAGRPWVGITALNVVFFKMSTFWSRPVLWYYFTCKSNRCSPLCRWWEVTVPWGLNDATMRPRGERSRGVVQRLVTDGGLLAGVRLDVVRLLWTVLFPLSRVVCVCVCGGWHHVLCGPGGGGVGQEHVNPRVRGTIYRTRGVIQVGFSFFLFTLDVHWLRSVGHPQVGLKTLSEQ